MYENSKIMYAGFKREKLNKYVYDCLICKMHQPLKRVTPIVPIVSKHPWWLVQTDCVDLRNFADVNDGYSWILNIIDSYSKFAFSFCLKNKTALDIKSSFQSVVRNEGFSISVQTDNGKEFANKLFGSILEDNYVKFVRGRPRHPKNKGQVERFNQTITRKIGKAISSQNNKRWIDVHEEVIFNYNTSWHRAINTIPMQAFRNISGVQQK